MAQPNDQKILIKNAVNNMIPNVLTNIIIEYADIQSKIREWAVRYIHEVFGDKVYKALNIDELCRQSIPIFELAITEIRRYFNKTNRQKIPWLTTDEKEQNTRWMDFYSDCISPVINVLQAEVYFYQLFPTFEIISIIVFSTLCGTKTYTDVAGNLNINRKYFKELITFSLGENI
jgi:hypothetical protein